jgi:hypothetical protein
MQALMFSVVFQDMEVLKPDGLVSSCPGFLCRAQKHHVPKYWAASLTVLFTTLWFSFCQFYTSVVAVFDPSNPLLPQMYYLYIPVYLLVYVGLFLSSKL